MQTPEELIAFLNEATADGVRGRLLYRGEAWSLMRESGSLPQDAPDFGPTIETDLAEYGFALLQAAMALRIQVGTSDLTNSAFERAARAFEALVRNGDTSTPDYSFHYVIAAVAYHLAGYSAVAYSLFNQTEDNLDITPGETAIRHLVLRDLSRLRGFVRDWLEDEAHNDNHITDMLKDDDADLDEVLSIILNTTICRALAFFDFALETGHEEPVRTAINLLNRAIVLSDNAENVPLWWISNLCRHLIDDIWQQSLHRIIPINSPPEGDEKYPDLRKLFIGLLYARKASEIEVWPSQKEAVRRSTDITDNLVVSLPTSAGKTRVAEVATLMTLSRNQRALIVTPLRALSAQTERSFRRTFAPLGFSVSSLYGASGYLPGDENALRNRDIIVATPEKLDFAIRSDPSLIDDIGLIVLDEGHMIGPSEREIRYETLVQRLIQRTDAEKRRIVCLSAVLPSGDELNDLTAWIRADKPGSPVRSEWRPTRQRFGSLVWRGNNARLDLDYSTGVPFIDKFVMAQPLQGKETRSYPRMNSELVLFAAWKFANQNKRTLVFLTQANWVESYSKKIVELHRKNRLSHLLEDQSSIMRALEVGKEWLGEDHPVVACLRIGVAIHYGRLPTPFLRELEILISEDKLNIIVASPTLSQGLNINAAVLLVPTLYRARKIIRGEEFANIAGRAGRAFVDVEGLIVHVIYEKIEKEGIKWRRKEQNKIKWRRKEWKKLVESTKARSLKSGLIQIVVGIIDYLSQEGVLERGDAWEYLANNREAWTVSDESVDNNEEESMPRLIERLDITILGLIEALDSDSADLPILLDETLNGSLWERQILREQEDVISRQKRIIEARANIIWRNTTAQARRGYFAMGVGLESGLSIDAIAQEMMALLDSADKSAMVGDADNLADALECLGEKLLFIRPFAPDQRDGLPENWKNILRAWVSGEEVTEIGVDSMRVVEDVFAYRLVWALEAIRTRRYLIDSPLDFIEGGAAAAIETGVPKLMMAMLIRAGLPSRRAAIAAIEISKPHFYDSLGMQDWLNSEEIVNYTDTDNWPTSDTAELWRRFHKNFLSRENQKWSIKKYRIQINGKKSVSDKYYRIVATDESQEKQLITSPDYRKIGSLRDSLSISGHSLFSGRLSESGDYIDALYVGPTEH